MPAYASPRPTGFLTDEDIRSYLLDTAVQQTALGLDLRFSDDEIAKARHRAARAFNSIPPIGVGGKPDPERLPGDTNIFLDGVAHQLYLSKLVWLQAQDVDYKAGNADVNLVSAQIKHAEACIKLFGTQFREAAQAMKVTINLSHCWGRL